MIAAVALAAVAFVASAPPSTEGAATVEIKARIENFYTTERECGDLAEDDWYLGVRPGTSVQVTDRDGRLLGVGYLDDGLKMPRSCVFTASFTAEASEDGTYLVLTEQDPNGVLYGPEHALADGSVSIAMVINDLDHDLMPDDEGDAEDDGSSASQAYRDAFAIFRAREWDKTLCWEWENDVLTDASIGNIYPALETGVVRAMLDSWCWMGGYRFQR